MFHLLHNAQFAESGKRAIRDIYNAEAYLERLVYLCDRRSSEKLLRMAKIIYPDPDLSETHSKEPRTCVYFQHYRCRFAECAFINYTHQGRPT